jgi:catechol 2,3-dioxygenase-like lactoylglutathione lyase family enzyme
MNYNEDMKYIKDLLYIIYWICGRGSYFLTLEKEKNEECNFSNKQIFFIKMKQKIAYITLVVDDYNKAIEFYTKKLNFTLVEDSVLSESKRWVLVAPKGSTECCLLLAKAANNEQISKIGNQTGGRVFLFLYTDNFQRDYQNLLDKGINIVREPTKESYGTVAVFEDLYGNLWDLLEPSTQ